MEKVCEQCGQKFEFSSEDQKYLETVSPVFDGKKYLIPPPKLCPVCRLQRRFAFRNERKLYTRKCDLTGKQIISMHSPDKPYKVYDKDEWWSDKWDDTVFGRDFDFSRSFADQFIELFNSVPHMSLNTRSSEQNSYYNNFALNQKNCYLIYGSGGAEDCIFGKFVTDCKDCLDSLCLYSCELCYQGVGSEGCYSCKYFINSRNCRDCLMIEDCQSCSNCVACFGLRNKEYCIMNKFVGREEFEKLMGNYKYLTSELIENLRQNLKKLSLSLPHVGSHIFASEDSTGEAVFNCKNCDFAFDCRESEDSKYIYYAPRTYMTQDCTFCSPGPVRFSYNVCSIVDLDSCMCDFYIWFGHNVYYSIECQSCSNIFGCSGLKNKKYCIFNKQYSKEDYEKMVARVVEHMQKTGEWGEFFPYKVASFGYNETVANEYFPLDKEGIQKIGANFYEEKKEAEYYGDPYIPPESIDDVSDDICDRILKCEVTGKYYKIIPQELKFYKRLGLPIPKRSPDQRHYDRLKLHNFLQLWDRECSKCKKMIKSIHDSNCPEIVYCEECYLKEVY